MKRLLFDIETSPCVGYFWRPGYNLTIPYENIIKESAIICICYKWHGKEQVYSMTWSGGDDKGMLKNFLDIVRTADEVIGHNSDRFDLKWLRSRCLYHRLPCPSHVQSFDTLKASRGQFNLNSNRLDYIAKYLGVGRKNNESGFGLWRGVMDGDKKSLKDMVNYCKNDVVILEKVYDEIYKYSKPKMHAGVMAGGFKHYCPSCGSHDVKRNRKSTTAAGTPKVQMVCNECNAYYTLTESVYYKSLSDENKMKALSMINE